MGQFESFIGVNFWTALFVLLNTLTIFFVAKKYLVGPVMKIIKERQTEIDDLYADAQTAKTEAEAMRDDYDRKLAQAQETSDRIVREAVSRGQAKEFEILTEARQQSQVIRDKAYQDIEQERRKARDELKGEISQLAVDIASKVVEREITSQDHEALIDEFIQGIGDDA